MLIKNKVTIYILSIFVLLICLVFTACKIVDSNTDVLEDDPNTEIVVIYSASEGGYIDGETEQLVISGEDAEEVIAVPDEGYRFIKWSDGITTAIRQDKEITENLNITAFFEKLSFEVNYYAGEGGHISGLANQTVQYDETTEWVTAVPNKGYKFLRWSDDWPHIQRHDIVKNDLSITALFEKISYIVNYSASEGGYIDGAIEQAVLFEESSSTVAAVPYYGYRFTGWNDGYPHAQRSDVVTDDLNVTALFKKVSYAVNYVASPGGYISGKAEQTVLYENASSTVTALPDEGYRFIGWDDGYPYAQRNDVITEDFDVTALFEIISNTYTYVYNNATENNTVSEVQIRYDTLYDIKFALPKRINSVFDGWYLDKDFKTKVTDENGNLVIDYKIFDYESEFLYAKFNLIEEVNYKILMVYVTEVEGEFETYTGEIRYIHYKMTDLVKQVYKILTKNFEKTLNEMFAGLVNFEVDEYFTSEVIGRESFSVGYTAAYGNHEYRLFADRIPELSSEFLDGYRSVLTTVQLGDMQQPRLHSSSGEAFQKYGCIFSDTFVVFYADSLEQYLDPDFIGWRSQMGNYLHEFTHTVEIGLPNLPYDYHDVIDIYIIRGIYNETLYVDEALARLMLLNQAEIDGKPYGIPYDFWRDEIYFNIDFVAGEGGTVIGNLHQQVKVGRDTETVVAVPDFGYRFVGWSYGGYFEPEITVKRVLFSDRTYEAIFEEITQDIVYFYDIRTLVPATLTYKDFLTTPLWVPEFEGYDFCGWYMSFDNDGNYYDPLCDEYGRTSEEGYKIFGSSPVIVLFPKLVKKQN